MDPASIIDAFGRFAAQFGIMPMLVCLAVLGLLVRDYYQMRQRNNYDSSIANVTAGMQRTTDTLTKLLEGQVAAIHLLADETKKTNSILEDVRSDLKRTCQMTPDQMQRLVRLRMHEKGISQEQAQEECDLYEQVRQSARSERNCE